MHLSRPSQPRWITGLQQHHRPYDWRYWHDIRNQHWLCPLAAFVWRTSTTRQMVAWQMGNTDQHHRPALRNLYHCDQLFPAVQPSHRKCSSRRRALFGAPNANVRSQAQSMNWGIAMFGGVAFISLVTYIVRGRKMYKGPVVNVAKA